MKSAVATLNQTPLDWEGNSRRIIHTIREAKSNGVQLLILPELCVSGYGCQNHFLRKSVLDQTLQTVLDILPETSDIMISLGFPYNFHGKTYNATAWVRDGAILLIHCKTKLSSRFYHEDSWFTPWNKYETNVCVIDGYDVMIGDYSDMNILLPGNDSSTRIHQVIGEIDWDNPDGYHTAHRTDVFVHSSASPFLFGKHEDRLGFIREMSKRHGCVYLFANHSGYDGGKYIFDGGATIAEGGEITASTNRFSYQDFQIACSTEIVKPESIEKNEEFARSVSLGLFDAMRKTRSKGFVLSLSGGADSATIATLVAIMVRMASNELGMESFLETLNYINGISDCDTPKKLMSRLLLCLYQCTENSSSETQLAARGLAELIGADFHEISIDGILRQYSGLITPIMGRDLTWEKDDAALQNIQARVRGPAAWFLANLRGSLLLATGNRSEATVGYTTMDGDTCGGLAPIGGVDKAFIRNWLRWMETTGIAINDQNRFKIEALELINELKPTAELRPKKFHQSDEDDLMPYSVLNRLEQLIIRDHQTESIAGAILENEFPQYDSNVIRQWVVRFESLWMRNQWKQFRYANAFYLDGESPAPEEWLKYPTFVGKNNQDG